MAYILSTSCSKRTALLVWVGNGGGLGAHGGKCGFSAALLRLREKDSERLGWLRAEEQHGHGAEADPPQTLALPPPLLLRGWEPLSRQRPTPPSHSAVRRRPREGSNPGRRSVRGSTAQPH